MVKISRLSSENKQFIHIFLMSVSNIDIMKQLYPCASHIVSHTPVASLECLPKQIYMTGSDSSHTDGKASSRAAEPSLWGEPLEDRDSRHVCRQQLTTRAAGQEGSRQPLPAAGRRTSSHVWRERAWTRSSHWNVPRRDRRHSVDRIRTAWGCVGIPVHRSRSSPPLPDLCFHDCLN